MHIPAIGSKAQVWHGTAKHTSGGLTKSQLMKNKHGHIVSKKQHARGKVAIKQLTRRGYIAKRGTFHAFHKNEGHSYRSSSRRSRGRGRGRRALKGGFEPSDMSVADLLKSAAPYASS